MDSDQQGLTIGAVAKAAGVNVETVRFYQRRALLPEPDKPYGRIRRYEAKDEARVRFVKAAQRLGFSLDEVAGLLKLDDGTHCDEARQLAEAKLGDVRKNLEKLLTEREPFYREVADITIDTGSRLFCTSHLRLLYMKPFIVIGAAASSSV